MPCSGVLASAPRLLYPVIMIPGLINQRNGLLTRFPMPWAGCALLAPYLIADPFPGREGKEVAGGHH